jgi:hypothetical protein
MEDSLQTTRVITAMSPFTPSNSSTRGLLAIVHEVHSSSSGFVTLIIKMILHLGNTVPAVTDYLTKQIREMQWLEQYLEARINSMTDDNPTAPARLAYLGVKKFLADHGAEREPNFEKERELMEDIDSYKRENMKLKEALEYYRSRAPNVKPPDFMLTKKWDQAKEKGFSGGPKFIALSVSDSEEDDDTEDEDQPIMMPPPVIISSSSNSSNQPTTLNGRGGVTESEVEERAKQLIEFFGGISMAVAMGALRKADYDLENAASLLSDDGIMAEIMREAEKEETTSGSNNLPGLSNYNLMMNSNSSSSSNGSNSNNHHGNNSNNANSNNSLMVIDSSESGDNHDGSNPSSKKQKTKDQLGSETLDIL